MQDVLKVWVDHTRCVGNGFCVMTSEKVFVHNEDRQSEVIDPGADTPEKVLEAARNCPVSAIQVESAITGARLYP